MKKRLTGEKKFVILYKLAHEGVRKGRRGGSGPNLENDTETRNAQEERTMILGSRKVEGVMGDSEDSEE